MNDNFAKNTWAHFTSAGMRIHFDNDLRASHEHANETINTELTYLNEYVGFESWQECLDKTRKRIDEIDALYPPLRKASDRKEVITIDCKCPEEIYERGGLKAVKEYLRDSVDFYKGVFGEENVIGGLMHLDERHPYKDAAERLKGNDIDRISLYEIHIVAVPFAEWHEKSAPNAKKQYDRYRCGINAKWFLNRMKLKELSTKRDAYVHQKYSVMFHTHTKSIGLSVEDIKEMSNYYEQIDKLKALVETLSGQVEILEKLKTLETRIDNIIKIASEKPRKHMAMVLDDDYIMELNQIKSDFKDITKTINNIKPAMTQYADNVPAAVAYTAMENTFRNEMIKKEAALAKKEAELKEKEIELKELEHKLNERQERTVLKALEKLEKENKIIISSPELKKSILMAAVEKVSENPNISAGHLAKNIKNRENLWKSFDDHDDR